MSSCAACERDSLGINVRNSVAELVMVVCQGFLGIREDGEMDYLLGRNSNDYFRE